MEVYPHVYPPGVSLPPLLPPGVRLTLGFTLRGKIKNVRSLSPPHTFIYHCKMEGKIKNVQGLSTHMHSLISKHKAPAFTPKGKAYPWFYTRG